MDRANTDKSKTIICKAIVLLWLACAQLARSEQAAFVPYAGDVKNSAAPITAIWQDRFGLLWVATRGEGVRVLDGYTVRSLRAKDGLASDTILSLYADRAHNIWFGCDTGLCMYAHGQFSVYKAAAGFAGKKVLCICEDSQGKIWVGTDHGLGWVEKQALQSYKGFGDMEVNALLIDRSNQLWVGTVQGLNCVNISLNRNDQVPYIRGPVHALVNDQKDFIWVGSAIGLVALSHERVILNSYAVNDGLPGNVVHAIVQDANGGLWLASDGGICYFNGQFFQVFPSTLAQNQNALTSLCIDRTGKLWLGCNDGHLLCHQPTKEFALAAPPIPYLTRVKLFYRDAEFTSADASLGAPFPVPQHLTLPRAKNHVTFEFGCADLAESPQVQFQYKLDGFDDDWTPLTVERTATYAHIPPGTYMFHVKAVKGEHLWSNSDALCTIVVRGSFIQSSFFIVCAMIVILVLVVVVFQLRTRTLQEKAQKLKKMVDDQLLEVAHTNKVLEEQTVQMEMSNEELAEKSELLQEANKMLERLSNLDGLTGISNRRYFELFIDREWRRAMRNKNPVSILMVDVDYFKSYNDHYGHQAGDECLKKVASSLNVVNRVSDLTARYGGEEFVIVLGETDVPGAMHIAEIVMDKVKGQQIVHEYSQVSSQVTISMGVASFIPVPGSHYSELIAAADNALYQAKHTGRNRAFMAESNQAQ